MAPTTPQFAFIVLILKEAGAEVFSAIADIDRLLDTHGSVIENIENYLIAEIQRLETLYKLLNHYKKHHEYMEEDPNYIGNPLNSYTLIKRLTDDLNLVEYYATMAHTPFNKAIGVYLPSKEDLDGASSALLRIQNTYKLNATHLSKGIIQGTYSHGKQFYKEQTSPMTTSDLFELGRRAYIESDFRNAVTWLMEALNRLRSKPDDEVLNFSEADLVDWIRMSHHLMGDFSNALIWTEELLIMRPEHEDAKKRLLEYNNRLIKEEILMDSQEINEKIEYKSQEPPVDQFKETYQALCRGDHSLPDSITKSLHCYYKSGPDPFLMLARVKAELIYPDPQVLLFHDVISEDETQKIKLTAKTRMQEDPVRYPYGNRIATVLFYMSDVEQGGATIFTEFGLTVFPKKNSAIFWLNLHPSGQPDNRTKHGACPVLRGSKWVCNKWLHLGGQEFNRPCTLKYQA